jgi:putative aminopeptidase FrvX
MAVPPLLDSLLRAHGPAGHEHLAFDAVREGVGDVAEIETDAIGNLIARRAGAGEGPLLALFAHLDVIGLAVAHVPDDALIRVHTLGGWRAAIAYGQRVEIQTANGVVPGVVARQMRDDEKVEWRQLYVDIGARDGEEARTLVAPGDPMVVAAPPLELAGGRVASRSLDNRAGVYVALEALRRLAADGAIADVAVVAGAHEELGAAATAAAAHRLRPDVGVVLDVTYATDVPATEANEAGDHRLGGGPAIFRGPAIAPLVFGSLVEAARAAGIAYTVETGSRTYTDADRTYSSRGGIPTGVVSIPLRYMHSPIEIVELADLEACVNLLVAFARGLRPGVSYSR